MMKEWQGEDPFNFDSFEDGKKNVYLFRRAVGFRQGLV
jgi:hypothetical protein